MTDHEAIERRLAAVERALTAGRATDDRRDGRRDTADSAPDATRVALDRRVETLEAELVGLDRRVADLDAAVQALRGYVGSVRHVNRAVERRAEAALAAAERAGTDPIPPERPAGPETAERPAGTKAAESTGTDPAAAEPADTHPAAERAGAEPAAERAGTHSTGDLPADPD